MASVLLIAFLVVSAGVMVSIIALYVRSRNVGYLLLGVSIVVCPWIETVFAPLVLRGPIDKVLTEKGGFLASVLSQTGWPLWYFVQCSYFGLKVVQVALMLAGFLLLLRGARRGKEGSASSDGPR